MKVLLKEIRNSRKLSQNKLAQLIGMTLQNVQRIEYGDAKGIQFDTLAKLCEALNCKPGDLLVYHSDDGDHETIPSQVGDEDLDQGKQISDTAVSGVRRRTRSILRVVPELQESA